MNIRKKIVPLILSTIILGLFIIDKIYQSNYDSAKKAYIVYLEGEEMGLINNNNELYDLINNEQQEIKNKYKVDSVYPPASFELAETNTFNNNFLDVNEVYKKIEELDNFTIKGYIITIKENDEAGTEKIINVLDKEVFNESIHNFILSFISENQLNTYLSGIVTISDIGSIISKMYFNETITIREGYISVNEKIYTDADSLSQALLFGPDAKMDSYEVKLGDDIESISEDYLINPQEFIIANPVYRDTKTMLKVGTKVNVTLLNPMLTLVYEMYEITEKTTPFTSKTVLDNTKGPDYSEITQAGVSGISLDHVSYQVINGEASSELKLIERQDIRQMVEQITTIGKKAPQISGNYVNISGSWGLPTNYPYYLTSPYGWRSHKMHLGVDLSGTGYGSPIYAVGDGVVVEASFRNTDGNFVIIQHDNNVYTQYAHMSRIIVKEGQSVKKGTKIGEMGNSGLAFGTHLHFGVSIGWPYHGAYQFQDPRKYINF